MRNQQHRRALTALALMGALATQLVPATPAHAVAGLQRIMASTASNTSSPKTVSAACPPGTVVIGGGGGVIGGNGNVGLTGMEPVASQNTFKASAGSIGVTPNWSLEVVAICADAGAVNGLEYMVDHDPQHPTATCSAGKKVIGVGGAVLASSAHVALADVHPDPNLSAVAVHVVVDPVPVVVTWTARAWAICATPPPGLVLQTSAPTPGNASVACPEGTFAHGAGSEILGGASQQGHVRPRRISTYDFFTPLAGVVASAQADLHNPPSGWTVRAYAICAP